MSNMYLLQPEYQYHAERTREELRPVRYRKWRRRVARDRAAAAANETNWIN